jgi:DNA polymerase III subunit gamma/tau
VWDTLYRPLTFADVLGQTGTVQLLKARLKNGTALDTSYIFSGGSGQGKTTIARIFARAMLCHNLDKNNPEPCNKCESCLSILNDTSMVFVEQDAASQGNIEQVRRIVDELPFTVMGAAKRIYLFDECHRMSKDAQDVLLKPLEERKMLGMFCTTEPEKVRGAIRSRCEEYSIRRVTREDILVRMKRILEAEGVEYEDDAILIVIDFSGGHVRDVLNRLEMIAQVGPVKIADVREHLNLSTVSTYYEILLNIPSNLRQALLLVDSVCERVTPEEVASGLAEAAMNSFRLANGMSADFTFADKELGAKVSKVYEQGLTLVAEHFLRSRYTTQIGLICDITTLNQRLRSGILTRQVQEITQAIAVNTLIQTEATQTAPPSVASVEPTLEATPPVRTTTITPPPSEPQDIDGLRKDGKGNKGSSDHQALTENDTAVIPEELPTQSRRQKPISFDTKSRDGRVVLPPSDWRREFEGIWIGRGAGDN